MSGYQGALEAAGATVHHFFEAGSYQGEWYAFVWFKGHVGWVTGNYGSCSGCDAFEGEFDGAYRQDNSKGETEAQYNARLAQFGLSYLGENGDNIDTHDALMQRLVKQSYIGVDDEEAIDRLNAIGVGMGFAHVERVKEKE